MFVTPEGEREFHPLMAPWRAIVTCFGRFVFSAVGRNIMMWRRWLVLAFSSLCLLLSGCALMHPGTWDTRVKSAGKVERPSVLPANVAIYQRADQVPGPYDKIAEVNEVGEDDERVLYLMQRRAGEFGANAIIVVRLRDTNFREVNFTGERRQGKAIAIFVHPKRKDSPPSKQKDPDEGPWARGAASAPPRPRV